MRHLYCRRYLVFSFYTLSGCRNTFHRAKLFHILWFSSLPSARQSAIFVCLPSRDSTISFKTESSYYRRNNNAECIIVFKDMRSWRLSPAQRKLSWDVRETPLNVYPMAKGLSQTFVFNILKVLWKIQQAVPCRPFRILSLSFNHFSAFYSIIAEIFQYKAHIVKRIFHTGFRMRLPFLPLKFSNADIIFSVSGNTESGIIFVRGGLWTGTIEKNFEGRQFIVEFFDDKNSLCHTSKRM